VILTDREIKIYIERKLIVVDPVPAPEAFASSSVDLTLDPIISLFKTERPPGIDSVIDPTNPGFKSDAVVKELTTNHTIDPSVGYELKRHHLILAWTTEYIDLKEARLAARVEGKSSLARLGLAVHMTAPTIHAGFDGRIRLEVVNHGFFPIRLKPKMRICQLIFELTFGTPDKGYQGQFQGQSAAT
jgi:dCTP deaminase